MQVPAVDPAKPRRLRAAIEPLARSGAGRWWLIHVSPKLDRAIFRLSGGRFTSLPLPMLALTHRGARSGERRETLLAYFTDGDDLIVMASNYGRGRHPSWYYNLRANPEVKVTVVGRTLDCIAAVTSGDDRERLWGLAKRLTKGYADYEQTAEGRRIEVFRLSPVAAGPPSSSSARARGR